MDPLCPSDCALSVLPHSESCRLDPFKIFGAWLLPTAQPSSSSLDLTQLIKFIAFFPSYIANGASARDKKNEPSYVVRICRQKESRKGLLIQI